MDAIWKQKWIDALRSGKYNKGTGHLKYKDNTGKLCHCALGVLCEIYSKENEICVGDTESLLDGHKRVIYTFDFQDNVLPSKIQEHLHINEGGSFYDENNVNYTIWELNDSVYKNLTFPEIAEYVEKYF